MEKIREKMSNIDKDELVKIISIITIILYPLLRLILERLINNSEIASYTTILIVAMLFIPGVINIFLRKTKKTLIMIGVFLCVIIVNYILHFETFEQSILVIVKNFITCYIMFMVVVNIDNGETLFKALKIAGYITISLTLFYVLLMQNNKSVLYENGLTIQLVLITFLSVNIIYFFKEKNILNTIFTILGVITISCFSSRTIIIVMWGLIAMLSISAYIKWLINIKDIKKKRLVLILTIIAIIFALILLVNLEVIATNIYNFLQSRGVYIRGLRLLAEGKYLSHTSGRLDNVYPKALEKIFEKPILGHGIGMDRIIDGNNIYYAHNFILELYVSYGIIIGSAIIVAIIIMMIKALKSKYKLFILGFIFSGLLILMLTTSYTIYRGFWLMLGILINILNLKENGEETLDEYKGRII